MNDAELAWTARAATGLSQRAFARLVGAHPATVAEWESGRGRLSRLARSLLRLVATDPGLAWEVLGAELPGQGERSKPCSCQARARVGRALRSPHPGALSGAELALGFAPAPPSECAAAAPRVLHLSPSRSVRGEA